MDLKKLFGTNQRAEEAGVWVDMGQGARVKVARDTSQSYRRRLQEVIRPYRGAITAGAMEDRAAHVLFAKAAAGTLLLDWEGIEVDGKPLPFSVEAAEQVMAELPDFYRTIESFAKDAALFREQREAAEQKN
jgi:hypothetical protein